jgi:hypothetical protein
MEFHNDQTKKPVSCKQLDLSFIKVADRRIQIGVMSSATAHIRWGIIAHPELQTELT